MDGPIAERKNERERRCRYRDIAREKRRETNGDQGTETKYKSEKKTKFEETGRQRQTERDERQKDRNR